MQDGEVRNGGEAIGDEPVLPGIKKPASFARLETV